MGIEPYLIADAAVGVIAQRLVRRLCPDCKKARKAGRDDLRLLMRAPDEDIILYEPCGCPRCEDPDLEGASASMRLWK